MAPGLPDRVDCTHLADIGAVLERVYPLGEMQRLQDLLADSRGSVRARIVFAKFGRDRAGASVTVEAMPQLLCQRCLQGFAFAAAGSSDIEFSSDLSSTAQTQREIYAMEDGLISLRELAEEELLLALPIVAVCGTQSTCGRACADEVVGELKGPVADQTRPFTGLRDLLKKT